MRRACAGIQGKPDRTLDHDLADGQIAAGCSQHGRFVFVQRLGTTNRNMVSAVLHMQKARRRGDNADGSAVPAQHAISARWVRKDRNGLFCTVYDSETGRKEKHAGTSRNPAKNRHGATNGKKRPFHRLLPTGNGFQDRPREPSNDSPYRRHPFGAGTAPASAQGDERGFSVPAGLRAWRCRSRSRRRGCRRQRSRRRGFPRKAGSRSAPRRAAGGSRTA